jgi:hypothetical protein
LGADKEVFLYEGIPHPVKCDKIRYYQDKRFTQRVLPKVNIPPLDIGQALPQLVQRAAEPASAPIPAPMPAPMPAPAPATVPVLQERELTPPQQRELGIVLGPQQQQDMEPQWRTQKAPLPPPAGAVPPPQEMHEGKPSPPYTYIRKGPLRQSRIAPSPPLWRWRPPVPPDAPPPDYGDFWQRYRPPPEGLIAPLSNEAPIQAILHGPRIRVIMGRLAIDEYLPEEGAHLSGLVPVHRGAYDHFHEQGLLRMLEQANRQAEEQYGPRPFYPPPPEPKRQPDLSRYKRQPNAPTEPNEPPPGVAPDPVFSRVSEQQEQEKAVGWAERSQAQHFD